MIETLNTVLAEDLLALKSMELMGTLFEFGVPDTGFVAPIGTYPVMLRPYVAKLFYKVDVTTATQMLVLPVLRRVGLTEQDIMAFHSETRYGSSYRRTGELLVQLGTHRGRVVVAKVYFYLPSEELRNKVCQESMRVWCGNAKIDIVAGQSRSSAPNTQARLRRLGAKMFQRQGPTTIGAAGLATGVLNFGIH